MIRVNKQKKEYLISLYIANYIRISMSDNLPELMVIYKITVRMLSIVLIFIILF